MFLSAINCLPLETVVTLFLFIQCSVLIYLFTTESLFLYIYLFIYLPQNTGFYLFIADRIEQHLKVTWTIGTGLSR